MVPFKLRRSLLLRKGFVRFRSKRQAFDTGSVGYAWKRERGPSPNSILNSELFSSLSGCFTVSHIHYQHLSDIALNSGCVNDNGNIENRSHDA